MCMYQTNFVGNWVKKRFFTYGGAIVLQFVELVHGYTTYSMVEEYDLVLLPELVKLSGRCRIDEVEVLYSATCMT
jgi:hypothetical protein